MGRLEGRVAIVTGAGSGNGLAIARAMAFEGAALAIGEYSVQRGEAAAESIQASGEAFFVETDVRRWSDVDRLVGETVARFGRLHHGQQRRRARRLCHLPGDLARVIRRRAVD